MIEILLDQFSEHIDDIELDVPKYLILDALSHIIELQYEVQKDKLIRVIGLSLDISSFYRHKSDAFSCLDIVMTLYYKYPTSKDSETDAITYIVKYIFEPSVSVFAESGTMSGFKDINVHHKNVLNTYEAYLQTFKKEEDE